MELLANSLPLIYPPCFSFWQAMQRGLVQPLRSEKYLAFVRSLPSAISGKTPCVAHHLVGHGTKGKHTKVSDLMTFALTPQEHRGAPGALHDLGSVDWEREHGDQRIYVMQTLVEAVYRGVLRLR
jgi:hypothetical protein